MIIVQIAKYELKEFLKHQGGDCPINHRPGEKPGRSPDCVTNKYILRFNPYSGGCGSGRISSDFLLPEDKACDVPEAIK